MLPSSIVLACIIALASSECASRVDGVRSLQCVSNQALLAEITPAEGGTKCVTMIPSQSGFFFDDDTVRCLMLFDDDIQSPWIPLPPPSPHPRYAFTAEGRPLSSLQRE